MFKRLGWAALLVTFFAAPAMAQGGFLCGAQGAGGVGDIGCDGTLLPATQLLADAPATTTLNVDITIEVLVDADTGNLWTGLAGIDPIANPVIGNRGPNAQDLIDAANAIQNMEALADQAAGAALRLEIERNIACAGVPLNLRHILCPKIL